MNIASLGRHLLAYALAVHFLFGSLSLLNQLNLSFFYYYPRIIRIVIFDPRIDLLVWAASVLCVSAMMVIASPKSNLKRVVQAIFAILSATLSLTLLVTSTGEFPSGLGVYLLFLIASLDFALLASSRDQIFEESSRSLIVLTLVYLLAFLVVIEISSAADYSLQSFDVNTPMGKQDAGTELQLSYASYGLLPWLYVALLFSWAWVPVVQRVLPQSARLFERNPAPTVFVDKPIQPSLGGRISGVLDPRLFLALALAVFIGYYTYFQNPPWIVGTDAYWRYYDPLIRMSARGPLGAFAQALKEWHPVPLMIFYAVHLALGLSLFDVVRMAQLLLVVLLGFSMWWFLGYKRNFNFGLTVFLLAVFSITTTLGFYASILANWMALVVWVLFFAYVSYRGTEKFRVIDYLVLLFLSTMLLFLHPWTWGVFATAVVVAAIMTLAQEKRRGLMGAGLVLAVVVTDCLLAFAIIVYLSSQGRGVLDALGLYTFVIGNPSSVFWFWDALTWLTRIWSPFFSPLYLVVSLVGVFSLRSPTIKPWFKRLIFAWLFVSAIGSILVAPIGFNVADPSGSETQLWRLLYITPFSVLAPLGITWLSNLAGGSAGTPQEQSGKDWDGRSPRIWFGLLVLIGLGLAWTSVWQRILLVIFLLPLLTGLLIRTRSAETKSLQALVLALFILVAFNNTTRALSQLLREPHNYRPQ
jgi:hypothetical protein